MASSSKGDKKNNKKNAGIKHERSDDTEDCEDDDDNDDPIKATASSARPNKKIKDGSGGDTIPTKARPFALGTIFNHRTSDPMSSILKRETLSAIAHDKTMDGFKLVNKEDMEQCEGKTQIEPDLVMATLFITNAIFGGEISFDSGTPIPRDEQRIMSAYWTKFGCEMWHQLWTYGFTAVSYVPNSTYVAVPVVMDLTQIDVYIRTTIYNERAYLYKRRSVGSVDPVTANVREAVHVGGRGGGGNGTNETGVIPNIMTFEYKRPANDGTIRSTVMSTLPGLVYTKTRMQLQLRAEQARASPSFFTQKLPEQKHNPNKLTGVGKVPGSEDDEKKVNSRRTPEEREMAHASGNIYELGRYYGVDRLYAAIMQIQAEETTRSTTGRGIGDRVDIPNGRELKIATMPEAPTELIKARLLQQSSTFNSFGIPASLLQTESSTGRTTANPDSMQTWHANLRVLKQTTENIFYDVERFLYDALRLLRLMEKQLKGGEFDEKAFIKASQVVIRLPGIPSEEKLENWYKLGILNVEAYKAYIASNNSLELSDLSSNPDPPQTEWEPPPPPKDGTPTKKKKKATTKKKKKKKKPKSTK